MTTTPIFNGPTRSATYPALASAVRAEVCVLGGIGVANRTSGLRGIAGAGADSSKNVFACCNRLKVIGIKASRSSAKVVKVMACRNSANHDFVSQPVSRQHAVVYPNRAVTASGCSGENPTPAVLNRHPFHHSFERRPIGAEWSMGIGGCHGNGWIAVRAPALVMERTPSLARRRAGASGDSASNINGHLGSDLRGVGGRVLAHRGRFALYQIRRVQNG